MRALFLAMVIASAALAQFGDLSKVEIRVQKVGGNVYVLEGAGGDTAAIVAHANVRKRLISGGKTPFIEFPPVSGKALPVVTFEADAKVIPGHGPVTGVAELRRYRGMLEEVVATVKKSLAAGKTVEQMRKENVLAPWEGWGKGFVKADDFLPVVAKDLAKKREEPGR